MGSSYSPDPYSIQNRSLSRALGTEARIGGYEVMASFRRPQTAVVLDGSTDPRYKYTINSNDLAATPGDAANFSIPFQHGLDYVPAVSGSIYVSTDTKRRPLPFVFNSVEGTAYFGSSPGAIITIESVDDLYIYVRATAYDALGLSFLSSNSELTFKFFCQREQSA